jgi:3',5'-cyclic AMP phosphodiesterase CpdA
MPAVVIAHLSDVHLGPMPPVPLRHLNLKRALGWINWQKGRRAVQRPEVADRLVADVRQQKPDQIAVGGDLVNIGLPFEYVRALAWMATVGPPEHVSLVPGNHDIYTTLHGDPGFERWRPYMTSHVTVQGAVDGFPYLRRFGDVALIGLNSAVPTPPAIATGRLGPEQIEAARQLLAQLAYEGKFRMVMIHHPPLPEQAKRGRELTDAADLAMMLETTGVELVVHGHNHRTMEAWVRLQSGKSYAPVIGVASGSAAKSHHGEDLARYHLFSIARNGAGWSIEMITRGLAVPDGPVIELGRRVLARP